MKTNLCFLIGILLMSYACEEKDIIIEDNIPVQSIWTTYSDNPLIEINQNYSGAQWNDPCVIKDTNQYIMYLSSNQGEAGENVAPFRALSTDGIIWNIETTPLLEKGTNSNDFDFAKIETPSVVFFNDLYHMYYTGVQTDLSGRLCIGHAISIDGITWEKDNNNPVIEPTNDYSNWNGAQVGEPGAVIYDNKIYVYFTAVGIRPNSATPTAIRAIGLSISDDGYVFSEPIKILEQSSLYPASDNYEGYSTPCAISIENRMHLFFDVAKICPSENPDWVQVAIHHAVSADGINNWIQDDKAIMIRSNNSWTKREIRAPSLILDDNELKMYFAGDDLLNTGQWGIGLAATDKENYY